MTVRPEFKFGTDFSFHDWTFDVYTGVLNLRYSNSEFGDFVESFEFPAVDPMRYQSIKPRLKAAIDCLHWMAGVSYYKTTLASKINFTNTPPSVLQCQWLTQTWQAGLAELAVENQLPWLDHIHFNGKEMPEDPVEPLHMAPRSLVAIGGGKDSLVSIEAIKKMGEPANLFMVGQSKFIQAVAAETGLPLLQIFRRVDPKLSQVNTAGAFNGHVPITAINACVAVVAALLYDFDSVVFSNERSADVGNFKTDEGRWVNHQHSKSLNYEQLWQQIIKQHIAADLHCFSLLRPFSELAIVQQFAQLNDYFPFFSSCNRNFHLAGSQNEHHHWCGSCPKCAFVFLCLAPFIKKSELLAIFHKDMIQDKSLIALFESLLGLEGVKPFECVGEEQECRLALKMLAQHPDWQDNRQVKNWLQSMPALDDEAAASILAPSKKHMIPDKRNFLQGLNHVA